MKAVDGGGGGKSEERKKVRKGQMGKERGEGEQRTSVRKECEQRGNRRMEGG